MRSSTSLSRDPKAPGRCSQVCRALLQPHLRIPTPPSPLFCKETACLPLWQPRPSRPVMPQFSGLRRELGHSISLPLSGLLPTSPPHQSTLGYVCLWSIAGYVRTPSELVYAGGGYTEMATVFSSFDSTLGHRTLVEDRRWTYDMFSFAISSAHLGDDSHGRVAIFEVSGLPSPQVIITQPRLDPTFRAVLFDLRSQGLEIETLEVSREDSILSSLRRLRQLPLGHGVFERLQACQCCCSVNGAFYEATAPLMPNTDVVQLFQVARAFCFGDARPPVPPVPVAPLASGAASSSRSSPPNSDPQQVLLPFLGNVIIIDGGQDRFSVLGTVEGVNNRKREPHWTSNQCLLDALSQAPGPSAFLNGFVMAHPLIGLFMPQVLLTRTAPHAGLATVACDLRALRLGVSVFEFRIGTTLRDLLRIGSVLFGELAQLGREHVACSFLHNGLPASPDSPITDATETVTLVPTDLSRTAAESTNAASRWQAHAGAGSPREEALQFTVFDHVHHFRVLSRQSRDTWDDLVGRALSLTPELPHAVGHPLEHVVPGLPLPHLVLLSSALGGLVVPVVYSFQPLSVCTVEVPSDASAFQIAYHCSSSCHALRTAHNQVARGTALLAGRNGILPQFRAGNVRGHEAVTLQGFQPGALRPRNWPSTAERGMPRWIETFSTISERL